MKRMNEQEWEQVMATMAGLWPEWTGKLTREQIQRFRDVLGNFPVAWVVPILNGHFDNSKFPPKLGELSAKLRELTSRHKASDVNPERDREERERLDAVWSEYRAAIDALSDEDLRGHVVRVVATDPRLAPFVARGDWRKSQSTAVAVCNRIRHDLGAHENTGLAFGAKKGEYDLVSLTDADIQTAVHLVAHEQKKRGNLVGAIAEAVAMPADVMAETGEAKP